MKLVGVCGYATSGKDTAALGLIERNWARVAFADPLKALARDLGWDGKKDEAGRKLLQTLGHQARVRLVPDVWIQATEREVGRAADGHAGVVVTDVRYPNEAQWIIERGGMMVRVDRPGVGPANGHAGETVVDQCMVHHTIVNEFTPLYLQQQLVILTGGFQWG